MRVHGGLHIGARMGHRHTGGGADDGLAIIGDGQHGAFASRVGFQIFGFVALVPIVKIRPFAEHAGAQRGEFSQQRHDLPAGPGLDP